MIEYLDMHILDLFQNAVASGASDIEISLVQDDRGVLRLGVRDNGVGMDDEALAAVRRGFYTSKPGKRVGLGLPLLRSVAEHCGGSFDLRSSHGRGTTVSASFCCDHIDLPPFENLAETLLAVLLGGDGARVRISCRGGGRDVEIDTAEVCSTLGDVPLLHPEVVGFLRTYLREHLDATSGGGEVSHTAG